MKLQFATAEKNPRTRVYRLLIETPDEEDVCLARSGSGFQVFVKPKDSPLKLFRMANERRLASLGQPGETIVAGGENGFGLASIPEEFEIYVSPLRIQLVLTAGYWNNVHSQVVSSFRHGFAKIGVTITAVEELPWAEMSDILDRELVL